MNSRSMFAVAAALSSLAEAAISETGAHQGHIVAERDHAIVDTSRTSEYTFVMVVTVVDVNTNDPAAYTATIKGDMATGIGTYLNTLLTLGAAPTVTCAMNCAAATNVAANAANSYPVFEATLSLTDAQVTLFEDAFTSSTTGWTLWASNTGVAAVRTQINAATGVAAASQIAVANILNAYLVPSSSSDQCTEFTTTTPVSFYGGTSAQTNGFTGNGPTAEQLTQADLGIANYFLVGLGAILPDDTTVQAGAGTFPAFRDVQKASSLSKCTGVESTVTSGKYDEATCTMTYNACSFTGYAAVRNIKQLPLLTQTVSPENANVFPLTTSKYTTALSLGTANGQLTYWFNAAANLVATAAGATAFDFAQAQATTAGTAITRFSLPTAVVDPNAHSSTKSCRQVLIRFKPGGSSAAVLAAAAEPATMGLGIQQYLAAFAGYTLDSTAATVLTNQPSMVNGGVFVSNATCESGSSATQCLYDGTVADSGVVFNTTFCPPGNGVATANNFVQTVVLGSAAQVTAAHTALATAINNEFATSPNLVGTDVVQIIMYSVAGSDSSSPFVAANTEKYITINQISSSAMQSTFFTAGWYFLPADVTIVYSNGGSQKFPSTAVVNRNSFTMAGITFAAGTALDLFVSYNTTTGALIAQAGSAAGTLMTEAQACATLFNCDVRSRGSGGLGATITSLRTGNISSGNNALTFTNGTADISGGGGSCFSGDTVVATEHGSVPMSELSVGDLVQTAAGLQPVVSFIHHGVDSSMKFVQINHDQGLIEMSDNHMLHLVDGRAVPARDIQVGDRLVGVDGTASLVKEIATVEKSSWMAPITESGTIMAGGASASAYVQENGTSHWVAHFGFAPVRFLASAFSFMERAADFPKAFVKPFVMS